MRCTGSELDTYLRTYQTASSQAFLKSERPYLDLLARGILQPGMVIRVHDDMGSLTDPHYVIMGDGKLVRADRDDTRGQGARQVLSEDAAPEGWSIVSHITIPDTVPRARTG